MLTLFLELGTAYQPNNSVQMHDFAPEYPKTVQFFGFPRLNIKSRFKIFRVLIQKNVTQRLQFIVSNQNNVKIVFIHLVFV